VASCAALLQKFEDAVEGAIALQYHNRSGEYEMTEMKFESVRFVAVDGLRIRYMRGGKRSEIPLLLTSPWPESLFAFHRIWPFVEERGEVVAVDLPGFGQSEGRSDVLSPKGMAKFVPRVLDALDLGRVHAVAPDIGTSALLLSASQHPDRFESLVVGSGATDVATAAGSLKDIILAPSTSAFEGTDGAELAIRAVKRMMRTTPDLRVLQDYAASSAGRRFVEAMAYVRAYPADLPALHELLSSIRTPVLSIWGSQDPLVPPVNAEILDRSLPSTRSLLLDSSHFVWEDQADAYATAVVEWTEGGYRSA
jgi:pimeloyl-ACP methyl ester carboxylesterase